MQHIDQSLRTVATQLLNVSRPEEPGKIQDNAIKKPSTNQKANETTLGKEMSSNVQSSGVAFRPINSKFNYFETSHPGQAMAITEEELEKELSSTRLITAHKNHPTTTGGISTWILLNPPSTTMKTVDAEKKTKQPFETMIKMTVKPTTLMEKIETTERIVEKEKESTVPISTTVMPEEPVTITTTKKYVITATKKAGELKPVVTQVTEKIEIPQSSTLKVPETTTITVENNEPIATTTKKLVVRTTPKPKTNSTKIASKNTGSKTSRPNQQNRTKVSVRRTTLKPDIVKNENASTAKIEKVTFRPVQMVSTVKSNVESTEKPMFVTKIKASILMDTQKATTQSLISSTTGLPLTTTSKTTTVNKDSSEEVPVKTKPAGTKVNNVLKVQLKKPQDDEVKIEVKPVKVNAPLLKIEKVKNEIVKEEEKEKEVEKGKPEKEMESLDNTRIDSMKFDFNPELTKINVKTEIKESSSSTSTEASTISSVSSASSTKRPRNSPKRKKNKIRRRKPSTTTTTTVSTLTSSSTENDLLIDAEIAAGENGLQESKILPETKVATNLTKTKKKPGSTPISMQIYNFLSREVMPSFGVMSLVGLGLGLASYFLYPFGGAVARRNYELEPKYKYNFDEYGGNYGQSEEEVLAKVLQGMTNDDTKYPGSKDYNKNYYKYQHFEGGYDPQSTKKNDVKYPSSSAIYRQETVNSAVKYQNTNDYRYPDAPSTTNYYDRPKQPEYGADQAVSGPANRQFVVGSIPKEYPQYDKEISALPTPGKLTNNYESTESVQAQYDPTNVNQNFNFPGGSVQNYGQIQTARPEETYEEVEITPTAVAVEHGPRYFKARTVRHPEKLFSANVRNSRQKRDSVIQLIPTKRELEEQEKEDDLSNEILNIIDTTIPGENEYDTLKKKIKTKKEKEEEKVPLTESTSVKSETMPSSTGTDSMDISTDSSTAKDSTEVSSNSTEFEFETSTMSGPKTTVQSSEESVDETTKKPTEQNGFNLFNFVKKVAEIKFRLGLTILKHASEGFARYIGNVQKRINGEE